MLRDRTPSTQTSMGIAREKEGENRQFKPTDRQCLESCKNRDHWKLKTAGNGKNNDKKGMTKEFTTKRGQKNEEATRHDIINNNTILVYTH